MSAQDFKSTVARVDRRIGRKPGTPAMTPEERLERKREKNREYMARVKKERPEVYKKWDKDYRERNKEDLKKRKNLPEAREKRRQWANEYNREKYKSDPEFREQHAKHTKAYRDKCQKELDVLRAKWLAEEKECVDCKKVFPGIEFQGSRRQACKECKYQRLLKKSRDHSKAKPKKAKRATALWGRYRLDQAAYEQMLEAQKGCCAICGHSPEKTSNMCIDHCHFSGEIRGLLCRSCNGALGKLEPFLPIMLDYLFKPEELPEEVARELPDAVSENRQRDEDNPTVNP